MPDVSKLSLDGTTYKIKDDDARKYLDATNNRIDSEASARILGDTNLSNQIAALQGGIDSEASARTLGDTNLSNQIAALQRAVGSPLVASAASAMTDKTKIYVYTGSESGKTAGHWYYWNGSAWTDGGVYNATAFNADTTLSIANAAADAKITGLVKYGADLADKRQTFVWEQGGINNDGSNWSTNTRIRTLLTRVNKGTRITSIKYGRSCVVYCYPNGERITSTTLEASDVVIDHDCYIKIVAAFVDNTDISPASADSVVYITDYSSNANTFADRYIADKQIAYSEFSTGFYMLDSAEIGSPYRYLFEKDDNWKCINISVRSGQTIYIMNAYGGTDPRLWAFVNAGGILVSKAAKQASGNRVKLTAPADGRLLVNTNAANTGSTVIVLNQLDTSVNTAESLDVTLKTMIGNRQNLFDRTKHFENSTEGYINPSSKTFAADNKRTPIIKIEPNSTYLITCDTVSKKRYGTASRLAPMPVPLNSVFTDEVGQKYFYLTSGPSDSYLYIQLYRDADAVKDANVYIATLGVYKISTDSVNQFLNSAESMWENAYIDNSGAFTTSDSSISEKTLTTRYPIHKSIRCIKCDYPYVAQYHQYKTGATVFDIGDYVGSSGMSRLLAIPDNNYSYRISVVSALDSAITANAVAQHIQLKNTDVWPTKYGKSAYFYPLDAVGNYYAPHITDFTLFDRNTTTDQFYSALDALANASDGYIQKTILGKCSDNVHDLIRLDCNNMSGVDDVGTSRENKPKIVIVSAQHGGEKCSSYGLYYLLKDIINNSEEDSILGYIKDHVHLIIVPVGNPYGFDICKYENANDVNLNRNYEYNFDIHGSGSAPLSEPETQIIADLVKRERDAIYLCDYHCNGNGISLPSSAKPNWHSQLQTYDFVHDSIGIASKEHINNISAHWWEEYPFLDKDTYETCGFIDTGVWESGLPTLQGYGSRNGIVSNTFEGLNGFTGRTAFGAEGTKACTELIGNWIICIIKHFASFYGMSNFI